MRGLAEVIAAHWSYEPDRDYGAWLCECGAKIGDRSSGDLDALQQAHVAEAVTAWLGSEAVVEAATDGLVKSRLPWGTHSDRWSDQKWQLEFWDEAARAAIAAITEQATP